MQTPIFHLDSVDITSLDLVCLIPAGPHFILILSEERAQKFH